MKIKKQGWSKGLTKETDIRIKHMSDAKKGMIFTEAHKESLRGKTGAPGIPKSTTHKKKISESHRGMKKPWVNWPVLTGKNHPNWQDGKSFEPYGIEFNNELREKIRKRDNYTCQLTGKKQEKRKLSVHHIDYNKKNNAENNLISLSCIANTLVNYNREYWTKYFALKNV